jgi:Zn-dependent peptidase ImmA (M78 family)/transcriptional regulator with XRE-family HTH domain
LAAKPSPVTPDVVRWAVDEDGRSLADLAERLGVAEELLNAWMAGDALPAVGQVTKLSEVLRRPRALFFLPAPPTGASLPTGFRHPPGAERDVSQKARLEVRRARRVQDAISRVLEGEGEEVDLPRHSLQSAAAKAAAEVRDWSAVSVEEQKGWRGGLYAAFNGWRAALDDLGILVFAIEIGRGDVRGFASWDAYAPLITVNSSRVTPPARTFTLAHELAHLVTRSDAACLEPEGLLVDVDVERWCEEFAGAFLMPAPAVHELARSRGLGENIDSVRLLMSTFHVSARASALRLIDLGYATPALYRQVEAVFRPAPEPNVEADRAIKRPPTHRRREYEFGQRALRAVLNGLPEHEALRVLRMTVSDAREIADRVPGVDARI